MNNCQEQQPHTLVSGWLCMVQRPESPPTKLEKYFSITMHQYTTSYLPGPNQFLNIVHELISTDTQLYFINEK